MVGPVWTIVPFIENCVLSFVLNCACTFLCDAPYQLHAIFSEEKPSEYDLIHVLQNTTFGIPNGNYRKYVGLNTVQGFVKHKNFLEFQYRKKLFDNYSKTIDSDKVQMTTFRQMFARPPMSR